MRTVRAVTTILAMALGHAASAQPAPRHHPGIALPDALTALPADVDAVVACRSLSELRSSEAAAFIADSLAADAFDSVRDGWADLAGAIGMTPAEAFDAILGERVVLALRRGAEPMPDWTVQAAVSASTEQRLRKKLRVVPRTIVAGQTLYAVERGALELSVARPADRDGPARVVLAPAGSPLFEDILRAGAHNARSLLDTEPGRAIRELPRGDVIVLARLREQQQSWAVLVGTVGRASFEASIRGSLEHEGPAAARAAGWDERTVRGVAEGSLAAMFDSKASAVAVVGKEVERFVATDLRDLFHGDECLTGREAVLLAPGAAGGVTMLAAVELNDLQQGAALGDRAMDLMLEKFGMKPRGFDGLAPTAVRRADGGAVSLAWVFEPIAGPRGEGAAEAWWIHTNDPSRIDDARAMFVGLSAPERGVRTYARVRPGALLDAVVAGGVSLPEAVAGFRRIDSIEWVEREAPIGALNASIEVRFASPVSNTPRPRPVAGSRPAPKP